MDKKTIGTTDRDVLACGPSIILLTRESKRVKENEREMVRGPSIMLLTRHPLCITHVCGASLVYVAVSY